MAAMKIASVAVEKMRASFMMMMIVR